MLVSTAGAYLPGEQEPFDAKDELGDYSIRLLPASTPLERIAYAHDHYDHAAVNADPQVLLPLRHLEQRVEDGRLGAITPSFISFMGYQPDLERVLDEMLPRIRQAVHDEAADALLLVPA
jgi:D-proline reductase (dithiol) PrdB